MSRLLMQSGKKILRPYNTNLLIEHPEETGQSLAEWLEREYRITLLTETTIPGTDVTLVTVGDEKHCFPGNLLTLACASNLLYEEPDVVKYLNSTRNTIKVQLQYGLLNNTLVSIEDIPVEKRGLNCGCLCPSCSEPLIAKLGKKRQKHFAHTPGSVCKPEHAQQTALHMLAKEIIDQEKQFKFPSLCVFLDDISSDVDLGPRYELPPFLEYKKACTVTCSSVSLEKRVSDFVPDILFSKEKRTCLIEIAVTHFVDEVKMQKIENVGLPVVEVDLRGLSGQQITRDMVREALIHQTENKKWIFNPLRKQAIEWATEEYKQLHIAELERKKAERQKRIKAEQEAKKKQMKSALLLEELFVPENYERKLQQLRSNHKFQNVLKSLHFRNDLQGNFPFFLDIPITGEMVFSCDRRIWQATLFDMFIYYRNTEQNRTIQISIDKTQEYFAKYAKNIPIDWSLARKATIEFNGKRKNFTLFYDVIKQYLKYLEYIGFIDMFPYGFAYLTRAHSLVPPNQKHAKCLKEAIEQVDPFAPDIDEQIHTILYPHRQIFDTSFEYGEL